MADHPYLESLEEALEKVRTLDAFDPERADAKNRTFVYQYSLPGPKHWK